jgi:hypothetical protein
MVETFETDTVSIKVTIAREDTGAAFDLTDATFEAAASQRGKAAIAGDVTVVDAEDGIVLVTWPAGTFNPATYSWQLRVTKSGEVQTVVSDQIAVEPSIVVPE